MLLYLKYFWFNGENLPVQLMMVQGIAGEQGEKEGDSTEGMNSALTKGNLAIGSVGAVRKRAHWEESVSTQQGGATVHVRTEMTAELQPPNT